MFHHVVFVRLKERSELLQEELCRRFRDMEGRIETLVSVEAGADVLGTDRSWDVVLLTVFDSLEGMKAYQVHPVHQEVLAYLKTISTATATVDYIRDPLA